MQLSALFTPKTTFFTRLLEKHLTKKCNYVNETNIAMNLETVDSQISPLRKYGLPTHKEHLENIGFEACIHDPCFYIKNGITWTLAMICVWLDHITFYCPENDFRQWFKEKMSSKYIFGESSVFKWFWEKN